MPLFGSKFTPKKAPIRKSHITDIGRDADSLNSKDLLDDDGNAIKLLLGDHEAIFEDGQWMIGAESGENTNKTNEKLRKQILELKEENNLLKLKFDILLDMLTQTTAENCLYQKEIEKLKKNTK